MCFLVAVDNFCAAIKRFEPHCFRENVRLLQISPTYIEPIVPRKLSSDGRVISKHSLDKYTHMFCDFRLSNPRYLANLPQFDDYRSVEWYKALHWIVHNPSTKVYLIYSRWPNSKLRVLQS